MVNSIVRQAVAFADDGVGRFGVDRIALTCQPRGGQMPSSVHPLPEALKAHTVIPYGRGASVRIDGHGYQVTQQLGHYRGRSGNLSCRIEFNVMRRVRNRLASAGLYRLHNLSNVMGDNFVDPAMLDRAVDIHVEAISEMMSLIAEARAIYAQTLAIVFGLDRGVHEVAISISEIELTWDVTCSNALWAPKLWWQSWGDTFLDARTGPGPLLDGLPTINQAFSMPWKDVHAMSGSRVLHGRKAAGESYVLYPKTERVLRFEARIDGARAGFRLGHPIRLGCRQALDEDLTRLAQTAYEPLMSVRRDLLNERVLNPVDVWVAFAKAGRLPEKTRAIFDAFIAGNPFHNIDEQHSRELRRLKHARFVQLVGRGLWAPTGPLRQYLSKLFLVWTHPDNVDGPTGRGTAVNQRAPFVDGVRTVSTQDRPHNPVRFAATGVPARRRTRTDVAVSTSTPKMNDAP